MRFLTITLRRIAAATLVTTMAPPLAPSAHAAANPIAAQARYTAPTAALPQPAMPALAPVVGPTWRVGAMFGALSHRGVWPPTSCKSLLICPWRADLQPDYVMGAHAIYTAYRFQTLPMNIEIEGGLTQRFGRSHQTEFYLAPILRWTAFPWNDYVFTNVRLGLLGASYATGVSSWERANSGVGHGSRFLNYLLIEATLAPSQAAPFEMFVRLHHRSGIFGMIDRVRGGSNYVAAGVRFKLD